jgi:hypothetical protein
MGILVDNVPIFTYLFKKNLWQLKKQTLVR